MNCISDNEIVELLEDRLPADRRAGVLEELRRCDACRALVRELGGEPAHLTQMGPYQVGALLGGGAMGLVYRAHDPVLARDVALKIVATRDDRALAEGRLLATVRHRNVINIHAAGRADGLVYLAMELVEGTSLERALADGTIAWRTAVRWFRGAAQGLAAAHAAGVIHRDIKPANLLVDGDELRLADFGLASTTGDHPAGTLAYLAPEIADGAPATPASDQFALCVTLFEVLAGQRPFEGRGLDELRMAWARGVTTWPAIPQRLRRVIARGLAIDPRDRWPDLTAFADALPATSGRARWSWLAVPVAAAAVLAVRGGTPTCDAPDLAWAAHSNDPRLQSLLARLDHGWRDAFARTCAGPRATEQRTCLEHTRTRIEALLAVSADRDERLRAVAETPGPERCLVSSDPIPMLASDAGRRAEVLAALAKPLEARQALPPPAQDDAALALLRGQIAESLQDAPAAEAAFRRAIELAAAADRQATIADAQIALAYLVGFTENRHEAGEAYADAARVTAQRMGDVRRMAYARTSAAMVASARGDQAHAADELAAALGELARDGAPPLELAIVESRLGWVLREANRLGDARTHFERARQLRIEALGAEHPLVVACEIQLGTIDAIDGKPAAAIARYRAILDKLAPGPIQTSALSALAEAQFEMKDFAACEQTYTRLLAVRRTTHGEHSTDVARTYFDLAHVQDEQGKVEESITSYRAAAAIARSVLGGTHPEVATIELGLAFSLYHAHRLAEARTAITDAIAIDRAATGHDVDLANALAISSAIDQDEHRWAAARASLEECYAIRQRVLEPYDAALLKDTERALDKLYIAMGARAGKRQ